MEKTIRPFEVFNGKIRRQINLFDNKSYYVNLLSVYDMLICEKMAKTLTFQFGEENSHTNPTLDVLENACLSTMSLTDEFSNPIYNDPTELMKKFTADDMLTIVTEYNSLRKDYIGFDELNNTEFESIKKN